MKTFIFVFLLFLIVYPIATKKFRNPYKLYMVFGKKGSGKSTFLVKQAMRYMRKGYTVYTNMDDLCLENVRIIDAMDIGDFVPVENSLLLLDEVGMIYDNRDFKKFKPQTRDFYKLQRHYKVVVYLASQTYDIDKKLRDLTDSMFLVTNFLTVFSLVRPISKKVALTQATSEGESRIAENLKFQFITNWKITYIPRYIKYFQSFKAPALPEIDYKQPVNPVKFKGSPQKRRNERGASQTRENGAEKKSIVQRVHFWRIKK